MDFIKHLASHLWTDMICKLPEEKQIAIFSDRQMLLKVAAAFQELFEERFQEIRDGRHKCSSKCFVEYAFDMLDSQSPCREIDFSKALELATQILYNMPRSWLEERFETTAMRKMQIADRILNCEVRL